MRFVLLMLMTLCVGMPAHSKPVQFDTSPQIEVMNPIAVSVVDNAGFQVPDFGVDEAPVGVDLAPSFVHTQPDSSLDSFDAQDTAQRLPDVNEERECEKLSPGTAIGLSREHAIEEPALYVVVSAAALQPEGFELWRPASQLTDVRATGVHALKPLMGSAYADIGREPNPD